MQNATRTAPNLFVCLRCQFRQRLGLARPAKSTTYLNVLRNGTQTRNSSQTIAAWLPPEEEEEDAKREADDSLLANDPKIHANDQSSRPYLKAPLGVESLGDPAQALVLQENPPKKVIYRPLRSKGPSQLLRNGKHASAHHLLAEIDSEGGILSAEKALSNIEELKEAFLKTNIEEDGLLQLDEFEKLELSLQQGFEKKHLVEYLGKNAKPETFTDPFSIHRPYVSKTFSRSFWKAEPGRLERRQILPPTEDNVTAGRPFLPHGKRFQALSSATLSRRIIKECWNLYPKPKDTVEGEMILRLQPSHLRLIADHDRNPLKLISETYHAVLQPSPDGGYLHIRSSYSISKQVLRALVEQFQFINSAIVSTAPHRKSHSGIPSPITEKYISSIAKLTNTTVTKISSQDSSEVQSFKYLVHYLGPGTTDLEDFERILQMGPDYKSKIHGSTKYSVIHTEPRGQAQTVPVDHGESLPLSYRGSKRMRIAYPLTANLISEKRETSKPSKSKGKAIDTTNFSKLVVEFLQSRPQPSVNDGIPQPLSNHWLPEITNETYASFGYLTISTHDARKFKLSLRMKDVVMAFRETSRDMDTKFVPGVPVWGETMNKFRFSRTSKPGAPTISTIEGLLLTMEASPETELPPRLLGVLPKLEIQIWVEPKTRKPLFTRASFVVQDRELDLFLPGKMLDIQFRNRSSLLSRLRAPDPCFIDFLEASDLDVGGHARLKTPSTLHIHIPPQAIPDSEFYDRSLYSDGLPMRYKFSALEHRSTMRLMTNKESVSQSEASSLSEHALNYNAIEAGRIGGNRQELVVLGLRDPSEISMEREVANGESHSQEDTSNDETSDRAIRDFFVEESLLTREARELGPEGRAQRLVDAALSIGNDIESMHMGK